MRRNGSMVVMLLAAALLLGWWTKARCLVDGDGWVGGEEYTSWCYTDVFPLWFDEDLDEGATPYLDHPVEYPVLTGAQMWAADRLGRLLPGHPAVSFFHVTAAIGAGLLLWTMRSLRRLGAPPGRLAWFALAPTLVVYAFMNWDPLAIGLFVAALAAHRGDRDRLAGALVGLGAAAKLFPGLLLPVAVATRLAQRRRRDALELAGTAAAAWLAVNLPVMLAAPRGWARFWELNRDRYADFDSLWLLAMRLGQFELSTAAVNAAGAAVFVAGAVVIAVAGARRRDPSRWWELLLPLLAWFLLSNKVYSPQFSLWLLPLMVLALPSASAFAAFCVADLAVFFVRFSFLGAAAGIVPGADYPVFAAMIAIRAAVLLWVIADSTFGGAPGGAPTQQEQPAGVARLATGDAR